MATVFYVWQSWDEAKTRSIIENALRRAVKTLHANPELQLSQRPAIDQDARVMGGTAADISNVILEQIAKADAVVVDVTNIGQDTTGRLIPNPNALFELGYALGKLDDSRVILVANRDLGQDTMPFDIRNRTIHFFSATEGSRSAAEKSLAKRLAALLEPLVRASRTNSVLSVTSPVELQSCPAEDRTHIELRLEIANSGGPSLALQKGVIVYWDYNGIKDLPARPILDRIDVSPPEDQHDFELTFQQQALSPIAGLSTLELSLFVPMPPETCEMGIPFILSGIDDPALFQIRVTADRYRQVLTSSPPRRQEVLGYSVSVRPTDRPAVYVHGVAEVPWAAAIPSDVQ